jgi:hypothetical protein
MMIHEQSGPTPMQHVASDVHPTLADRTDDACSRLHQYQQQLRAELLAAASNDGARPAARWSWLCTSPVRAIESRVRGLVNAGYAGRETTSRGLALAEA